MIVKLRERTHYQVSLASGHVLGTFALASRWEGLAKLTDDRGRALIVQMPSGLAGSFDRLFSGLGPDCAGVDATVVSASTDCFERLKVQPA